jgi:hypothetical protein
MAVAQTPSMAELADLKAQIAALKDQQTHSLQVIELLEKRLDAIERTESPAPPAAKAPSQPAAAAAQPPQTGASTAAPQMQRRDLYSQNREAAARIDNEPLDPELIGFFRLGDTPTLLRFGGYAKVDLIHDFKLPGDPDAFITSLLPLQPVPPANSTNIHIRQSRLSAEIRRPGAFGPFRGYFEGDFFGAGPRIFNLRQFYGQVHNILGGWSYSTFMDIDSFPDTVDYEGPGGGVFTTQPQVRYTWPVTKANSIAFSAEKPTAEIDITNPNFPGVELATSTTPIPDFVVRYRYEVERGHVQFGSLFRSVGAAAAVPTTDSAITAHVFGWGFNLSGSWQTYGEDSILFQGAYGHGIGRYIQDLTGLGADASVNASKHLEATPAAGTFIAYQHYWKSPAWRSSATYGYAEVQNQFGQAPTFYHQTNYVSGNLIFNPRGSVNIGAEYIYGNLTAKDGTRGFGSRLQIGLQYDLFQWEKPKEPK